MNTTDAVALPSPDYGRVIRFCLGLMLTSILTMLFAALVTAGAVTYFLPKEYFSKVTMAVGPDSMGQTSVFGGSRQTYDPHQYASAQFVILQKTEILYPVIDRLGLTKAYASPGGKISQQDAYLRLKRSMQLKEVRNTALIEIGVYDTDAQRAADIANTIAVVYSEVRRAGLERNLNIHPTLNELGDALEKLRTKKEAAAELATQIRKRKGITDSDPEREDSHIGFADGAAKSIEARALSEYLDAKNKEIHERNVLKAAELDYSQSRATPVNGFPTALIWEKAERSQYPARPNVARYALLAAPVGLILGAGLFLFWNRKTRPRP